MTFDKFYSIIRPHKAASFNTVKREITIIFIVIFSFLYNIPHLFLTQSMDNSVFPMGRLKVHWVNFTIGCPLVFTLHSLLYFC